MKNHWKVLLQPSKQHELDIIIDELYMYLAHIVAVSEQELHRLGMCELHRLADVDDPHLILEPKQVVLAQICMNQGALILHGIHYLQSESKDEIEFSSCSFLSVLVIINNAKISVTRRLYLKISKLLEFWITGRNIILLVSVMIFQWGNHPYLRRQVLQIDLHQKNKIFSFIYFKIR